MVKRLQFLVSLKISYTVAMDTSKTYTHVFIKEKGGLSLETRETKFIGETRKYTKR